MFRTNEAGWDRLLRLSLAAIMIYFGFAGSATPPWDLALLVFAFYPFVTGLMGWDPVYVLTGFRGTRRPVDR